MSRHYPAGFARFYDTIYHHIRDGVDKEFFINEMSKVKGKVLEIGVGTGRLFIDALNNGADIHGIDISESMLEVALAKINEKDHYRISRQDMIDFAFDFRFDLIIAPFRVIMHLTDKGDQIRAIDNVFNHLNQGGKFIFDTFIPDLKQLVTGIRNVTDFEGEHEPGKKIRRVVSTRPDLLNQVINVNFHLEWEEDEELKQENWEVPLRFFFRYELEHLVERSLFKKYSILGDYKSNGLNKDSKEFIVVCNKM
jgi:SAM-dependent methyltransferase